MKFGIPATLLCLSLVGCNQTSSPTSPKPLKTDQAVVRAVLTQLAADGQPVCVEKETYGSPLSIYRIATQGRLQNVYALAWYPPKPFRPPHMPTLKELREAAKEERNADLAEPQARTDDLPADMQGELDHAAMALAPPKVPTHRVGIDTKLAPPGVIPRWWPTNIKKKKCPIQYVLSGVKYAPHVAFVAVRVEHWGTVYALVPHGDGWKPVAQWGTWLY